MFVYCSALIYVLIFAHSLKMCSYTPQNGSKTIKEIIKEMKYSCSVHSVCIASQWQLEYHLKSCFKYFMGTTKAALISSNLRSCSTQQAQTSSTVVSEGTPIQTVENMFQAYEDSLAFVDFFPSLSVNDSTLHIIQLI